MAETVAFIGLGLMGEPMARNLMKGGFVVRAWNRTASRAAALLQEGAFGASSPHDAVRGADFCVCMVADPPALDAVLGGDSGALAGLRPGASLVNMGTQAISQIEGIADRCRELGILFVDAPVTGSRFGAIEASLTILAGAEAKALERARPLLERLGKTILHVGKAGDGTRAKLVLNLIQSGMLTVWAEGLALGKRLGLSPALTLQVLEHSAGNAALFRYKGPFLLKRDFSTNFSLKLMLKDIQLALGEAGKLGVDLPGSQIVSEVFSESMAAGLGDEDFVAIAKIVEKRAGTKIEP